MKKIWLAIVIVLVVLGMYGVSVYNGFVSKDENVKKNFSELQAVYQRRVDLLPNLVAVVKANSEFEQTVLQQVSEARAMAAQATQTAIPQGEAFANLEKTQGELANAANRLVAVIENYPNLKATEAFSKLQTQIEGTERRIKIARNDFNEAIMGYNQSVRSFPASMFAKLFGFDLKEGFQADAGAAQAPEIKF
ncbi:MAG: LemA family protein [Chitinophagaceae bacterium]|jgi:LemA protein|nr:LemA family protein [Chitinophagaceae bacterium]MCU0404114.1 LemA family protein [Chitinophagaceae bacterium]